MLSGETIKLYLLFYYREVNGTVVAQLSLTNNCLVLSPMLSYFFCKKEKMLTILIHLQYTHFTCLLYNSTHSAKISTPTRGQIKHKIYESLTTVVNHSHLVL